MEHAPEVLPTDPVELSKLCDGALVSPDVFELVFYGRYTEARQLLERAEAAKR